MEQEKPFKTIEVTDSRTGSVCKVACMSCIRGHRTTSCGIPVCRTKVFWTVKRPGRPSNSCTCRFGATGRCQCVVAKSACPHKPKKGEKRSVDCRCDEQGRWCCLLEPEHWDALSALKKPQVEFYSTPEAMNASRTAQTTTSFPHTPSYSASTPQTINSIPNTPDPPSAVTQFMDLDQSQFNENGPPAAYQPPRVGMMGVGLPWGGEGHHGEDVLIWQGQSPQAPRNYTPRTTFKSPDAGLVHVFNSTTFGSAPPTPFSYVPSSEEQYHHTDFAPVTESFQDMSMTSHELEPAQSIGDKMMEDYYNYQFPSAICQNCGMNGCTCKNCPAVMQSMLDGSWAQCCSRKHVRNAVVNQPTLTARQQQELQQYTATMNGSTIGKDEVEQDIGMTEPSFDSNFSLDDLMLPSGTDTLDINEFLMTDPDPPSHGCSCGGKT